VKAPPIRWPKSIGTAARFLGSSIAELLQALAIVSGWLLVTRGIVELTTPKLWPISIGLLLLSIAGWGFLASLFWNGLYKLRHSAERADG
jgi:hypothetical protein